MNNIKTNEANKPNINISLFGDLNKRQKIILGITYSIYILLIGMFEIIAVNKIDYETSPIYLVRLFGFFRSMYFIGLAIVIMITTLTLSKINKFCEYNDDNNYDLNILESVIIDL